MKEFFGSAGICINKSNELLMVLQGKPEESKTWSVPSGKKKYNETYAECCRREVKEETGFITKVIDKIWIKKDKVTEIHYFLLKIISRKKIVCDPDGLIYNIEWKTAEEIKSLDLTYPNDREFLINLLEN